MGIRRPDIPVASNIVVFALFNLNLIVFLLLLVLLFRNLVKLWFERRHRVLGLAVQDQAGRSPSCRSPWPRRS